MMEITEQKDHAYTNVTCDQITPAEFIYKMSHKETEEFVKLRVSNSYLFSGQKNSSKWAWRTILKHMGLHHKMTHRQASKKFENLKKRHKVLKSAPDSLKGGPESWPFFNLMEAAADGRLEGSAPILKLLPYNTSNDDFLPAPTPKKRRVSSENVSSAVTFLACRPEIEVSLTGDEDDMALMEGCEETNDFIQEVDVSKNLEPQLSKTDRVLLQREKAVWDWENAAVDRERALLERERVTLERERAVMERERAIMEREKAVMEREREALIRERHELDKQKAKWGKMFEETVQADEAAGDLNKMNSDPTGRRERFLYLFEKLVENF